MFCLLIVFDAHSKCIKGLLSDYSWGTKSWDHCLVLASICGGWRGYLGIFENYLFRMGLYVRLDLGFRENYWCWLNRIWFLYLCACRSCFPCFSPIFRYDISFGL